MPKLSLDDLQRICFRQDQEIEGLKQKLAWLIEHYNKSLKEIDKRFELRYDLTEQNALAIQNLSTRMDMGGIPK